MNNLERTPRLFLTRGLPGSGKTRWSRQMSLKYKNLTVVSADDIRFTLYENYDYSKNKEKIVFEVLYEVVDTLLSLGKDVIVHNTNITYRGVSSFRKSFQRKSKLYIVDFTDVNIDICIYNDQQRLGNKVVGEAIINKFAKQLEIENKKKKWESFDVLLPLEADEELSNQQPVRFYNIYIPDLTLPDTVIIDIDGTLANIGERSPYDGTKYHLDKVNKPIAKLIGSFTKTLIVTGRDSKYRDTTEKWLADNDIRFEQLFMRAEGDYRPDYIVKQEIFFDLIAPHYNVELVLEDRKQVVEMWREIGLICAQVDEGNF